MVRDFCYGCYYTRNVNGLCDEHYDILENELENE